MKYKCIKCGDDSSTDEVFDSFIDEENINSIATCLKCGEKMTKFYKLIEINKW